MDAFSPVISQKNGYNYFYEYENTFFGSVLIKFSEPVEKDTAVTICLSEKSIDNTTWNRSYMNDELVGFGITFVESEVVIPKGTMECQLILPNRPLPINDYIISSDWEGGGVIPFCCCCIKCNDEINISEVQQLAVHTAFDDDASDFVSDNALLNEVYEFCKDTIKATTYAGVYVDGYRELRPYEADALINELGHFSVDNNYGVAKETIKYLLKKHTWPTEWILQTVSLVYEYYMYSGDIVFLKEIYPELEKCLLGDLLDENGLINISKCDGKIFSDLGITSLRDIIDWPENERDNFSTEEKDVLTYQQLKNAIENILMSKISEHMDCYYTGTLYRMNAESIIQGNSRLASPNSVVNAFYYDSLQKISFLAGEIGKKEESKKYSKEAENFKTLFQKMFISKETKLVMDTPSSKHSSLHSNMFALNFGLVPKENVKTVCSYMISKGMACSVYGSQYLLESLLKNGQEKYALDLITSKDSKSWYQMMYVTGSKLTTEAWNEDIKRDMDWNHAWGTAPVNIITRYIVGIRPVESGCKKMMFAPRPGDLSKFDSVVPFNDGKIEIHYTNEEGKVNIFVESTAPIVFSLPENADIESLEINNVTYDTDKVELNSGKFHITYSVY